MKPIHLERLLAKRLEQEPWRRFKPEVVRGWVVEYFRIKVAREREAA